MIRGGDGEWQAATICNRGYAGSIPTPASTFAARAEALTSAPAFNHTAEAMQSATELYASAVSFPRKEETQWKTKTMDENNAALR